MGKGYNKDKDDIQQILIDKRKIFLFDVINRSTAKPIVERLICMDIKNHKPIILYINSPGGDCYSTLSIIDAINIIKSKVITIICGECCSGASIVSVCGNKRYMTKNSYWMGHELQDTVDDYIGKLRYRIRSDEYLWNKIKDIYTQYTKLSDNDLKTIETGELWLSPQECLKKGVIDGII